MTNIHQPDPAEIAHLIETDELIRYAVEELGGQIIAVRDLYDPAVVPSELPEKWDIAYRESDIPAGMSGTQVLDSLAISCQNG